MVLDVNTVIQLQHKLERLKKEHAALSAEIQRLTNTAKTPLQDDIQVHRLKKEKLAIKDQITKLEAMLTPDIIA